jgi:integrase
MSELKVQRIRIEGRDGSEDVGYVITEDFIPIPDIARFLRSFNSYKTAERYAYSLIGYLNFLKTLNVRYDKVENSSVIEHYIKHLLGYSGEVSEMTSSKTYKSVEYDLAVIKSFYEWLEDNGVRKKDLHNPVLFGQKKKNGKSQLKKRFLYGQIYEFEMDKRITTKYRFSKPQEHKKWYETQEINAILNALPSVRDKLIFKISIECGCRISEILGLHLEDIDDDGDFPVLKIRRRTNADNEALVKSIDRDVSISRTLLDEISFYIRGERSTVDDEYSPYLFLNHKGLHRSKPVRRRNFLRILKDAAESVGIDPALIRTHSGRSTRAQEIATAMVKHPELGITEEFFRREMGWKSLETAKHYISDVNRELKAEKIGMLEEKRIEKHASIFDTLDENELE